MKTTFTQDWKDWISTNVNAGQDKDGIFKILIDEGYAYDAIVDQMKYKPSRPVSELVNPFQANAQQQRREAQPLYQGNNGLGIHPDQIFIPNAQTIASDKADLRFVEHFLSEAECEEIIDRIKSRLRPSSVANYDIDSDVRTSRTCDLGWLDDPFIKDIDSRICKLIGINPAYAEVLQGQYYEVGQEFKAHTDFFEPDEFETHCSEYGQRTFTVMIYLNEVEAGGETRFSRLDTQFRPVTGMAVIWNNLNPDGTPNPYTLHQATPVEKGYKAVITKWFRTTCPQTKTAPMMIKHPNEYVPNYTPSGIHKMPLAKPLFAKVNKFYHDNHNKIVEEFVEGDFIVSGHKSADKQQMHDRPSSSVVNLTQELRQEIHDALKPLMEQWCGKTLEPTFVYGIREYHNGAVLKMHRDRIDTHIISAIINVDQETDQDWPLVIEDNYYRTHFVRLKPGEMVFYEGGRLLHGRPIKFEGTSFANLFCHFKPTDYSAPSNPN